MRGVQGTSAAHNRVSDGAIPSPATKKPQALAPTSLSRGIFLQIFTRNYRASAKLVLLADNAIQISIQMTRERPSFTEPFFRFGGRANRFGPIRYNLNGFTAC